MDISTFAMMAAAVTLIVCLNSHKVGHSKKILDFVASKFLVIGFVISAGALVSSLVYSSVIGYEPCLLCWYGRIAIYPQALIFGMAIRKKDKTVLSYMMGLTIVGFIVSLYHYTIETIGTSPLPCSASGASCLTRYVYDYGFISIPFMELMAFTVLLLVLYIARKALKSS